jgi:3-isopropylmalate/(R)-2-methylmalate dehydratase small subunit
MNDYRRIRISGPALAVDGQNIDTDRIIPARFLLSVTFDEVGEHPFEDDRRQLRDAGKTHPFDDPARAEARILLVDGNFGCGSSREHAPQALLRWKRGIAAIVGESFAEIFFHNCVSLGIPCVKAAREDVQALKRAVAADATLEVSVDLEKNEVRAGALRIPVSLPDGARRQLLTGRWDVLPELIEGHEQVRALMETFKCP